MEHGYLASLGLPVIVLQNATASHSNTEDWSQSKENGNASGSFRSAKQRSEDEVEREKKAFESLFWVIGGEQLGPLQAALGGPLRPEDCLNFGAYVEFTQKRCASEAARLSRCGGFCLPAHPGAGALAAEACAEVAAKCKGSSDLDRQITRAKHRVQSDITSSWLCRQLMDDYIPPQEAGWNPDKVLEVFVDALEPPHTHLPHEPLWIHKANREDFISIDLKHGSYTALMLMARLCDPQLASRLGSGFKDMISAHSELEFLQRSRHFRQMVLGSLEHEYVKNWTAADVQKRVSAAGFEAVGRALASAPHRKPPASLGGELKLVDACIADSLHKTLNGFVLSPDTELVLGEELNESERSALRTMAGVAGLLTASHGLHQNRKLRLLKPPGYICKQGLAQSTSTIAGSSAWPTFGTDGVALWQLLTRQPDSELFGPDKKSRRQTVSVLKDRVMFGMQRAFTSTMKRLISQIAWRLVANSHCVATSLTLVHVGNDEIVFRIQNSKSVASADRLVFSLQSELESMLHARDKGFLMQCLHFDVFHTVPIKPGVAAHLMRRWVGHEFRGAEVAVKGVPKTIASNAYADLCREFDKATLSTCRAWIETQLSNRDVEEQDESAND